VGQRVFSFSFCASALPRENLLAATREKFWREKRLCLAQTLRRRRRGKQPSHGFRVSRGDVKYCSEKRLLTRGRGASMPRSTSPAAERRATSLATATFSVSGAYILRGRPRRASLQFPLLSCHLKRRNNLFSLNFLLGIGNPLEISGTFFV